MAKLGGRKGCEAAIKNQLAQIDNLEATIVSMKVAPDGKSATAKVKSTYEGKSREQTLPLVKEGGAAGRLAQEPLSCSARPYWRS